MADLEELLLVGSGAEEYTGAGGADDSEPSGEPYPERRSEGAAFTYFDGDGQEVTASQFKLLQRVRRAPARRARRADGRPRDRRTAGADNFTLCNFVTLHL